MPKRILAADDSRTIQRALSITFTHIPEFELHLCSSGSEALSLLRKETFSLLLLDYKLPDISCLSLCKKIRKLPNGKDLPILLLVGKSYDPQHTQQIGANGILRKPFLTHELLDRSAELTSTPTQSFAMFLQPLQDDFDIEIEFDDPILDAHAITGEMTPISLPTKKKSQSVEAHATTGEMRPIPLPKKGKQTIDFDEMGTTGEMQRVSSSSSSPVPKVAFNPPLTPPPLPPKGKAPKPKPKAPKPKSKAPIIPGPKKKEMPDPESLPFVLPETPFAALPPLNHEPDDPPANSIHPAQVSFALDDNPPTPQNDELPTGLPDELAPYALPSPEEHQSPFPPNPPSFAMPFDPDDQEHRQLNKAAPKKDPTRVTSPLSFQPSPEAPSPDELATTQDLPFPPKTPSPKSNPGATIETPQFSSVAATLDTPAFDLDEDAFANTMEAPLPKLELPSEQDPFGATLDIQIEIELEDDLHSQLGIEEDEEEEAHSPYSLDNAPAFLDEDDLEVEVEPRDYDPEAFQDTLPPTPLDQTLSTPPSGEQYEVLVGTPLEEDSSDELEFLLPTNGSPSLPNQASNVPEMISIDLSDDIEEIEETTQKSPSMDSFLSPESLFDDIEEIEEPSSQPLSMDSFPTNNSNFSTREKTLPSTPSPLLLDEAIIDDEPITTTSPQKPTWEEDTHPHHVTEPSQPWNNESPPPSTAPPWKQEEPSQNTTIPSTPAATGSFSTPAPNPTGSFSTSAPTGPTGSFSTHNVDPLSTSGPLPPVNQSGSLPPVNRSGPLPSVSQSGSLPPLGPPPSNNRSGPLPSVNQSGSLPPIRRSGPLPSVNQSGSLPPIEPKSSLFSSTTTNDLAPVGASADSSLKCPKQHIQLVFGTSFDLQALSDFLQFANHCREQIVSRLPPGAPPRLFLHCTHHQQNTYLTWGGDPLLLRVFFPTILESIGTIEERQREHIFQTLLQTAPSKQQKQITQHYLHVTMTIRPYAHILRELLKPLQRTPIRKIVSGLHNPIQEIYGDERDIGGIPALLNPHAFRHHALCQSLQQAISINSLTYLLENVFALSLRDIIPRNLPEASIYQAVLLHFEQRLQLPVLANAIHAKNPRFDPKPFTNN